MLWFRKQPSTRNQTVVDTNGRGVACFDFGIRPPEMILSQLVSTGLAWFWTSSRSGPELEWSRPDLPEIRKLVHLTEQSAQAFADDYRDNWRGQEGREITVVAVNSDSVHIVDSENNLDDALRNFASEGVGPVQAIINLEDDGDEVMYTLWPLSEPIRKLLASWQIPPDDIRDLGRKHWKRWQTKGSKH